MLIGVIGGFIFYLTAEPAELNIFFLFKHGETYKNLFCFFLCSSVFICGFFHISVRLLLILPGPGSISNPRFQNL